MFCWMEKQDQIPKQKLGYTLSNVCTRECGHFQTPFWPLFILNVHWTKTFDWTILSSTSILFLKYIIILSLIPETKTLQGTHLMTKSEKAWWSPMVTGISMKSTFWKVLCSSVLFSQCTDSEEFNIINKYLILAQYPIAFCVFLIKGVWKCFYSGIS